MSFEHLLQLAPPLFPPVGTGEVSQWSTVENQLGITLPSDYKRLINTYGTGCFGNYIRLLSPFVEYPNLIRFVFGLHETYEMYRRQIPEAYPPFPAFPEPGGLLAWGQDDSSGLVCWLTSGLPDEWKIVVLDSEYSEIYYEYDLSAVEFLDQWLSGQISPECYPEDVYPFVEPYFRREIDYMECVTKVPYSSRWVDLDQAYRRDREILDTGLPDDG